jgi:hypothetical protein
MCPHSFNGDEFKYYIFIAVRPTFRSCLGLAGAQVWGLELLQALLPSVEVAALKP